MARTRVHTNARGCHSRYYVIARTRLLILVLLGLICLYTIAVLLQHHGQKATIAGTESEATKKLQRTTQNDSHPPPASRYQSSLVPNVLSEAQSTPCFTDQCQVFVRRDTGPPNITLLIGVISDIYRDASFRSVARETWVKSANEIADVQVLFFFPFDSAELADESAAHHDVIISTSSNDSMPIGYQMLSNFALRFSARHILRVDVRSYVVVSRLMEGLDKACTRPGCDGQAIWAGNQMIGQHLVPDGTGHRRHTGLGTYLPYMKSGAYVLSHSLASALTLMHNRIGLKVLGDEDVSIGLWLIPIPVTRIDFSSSFYVNSPCCVLGGRPVVDICKQSSAGELPIVLSVLDKPEYLVMYHALLARCNK
jgi:hypothetical protein